MRIAVFAKATTFHKGYGGLETQNKILCEGLAARKHKVTVFSPQESVDFLEKEENGVLYRFIPCKFKLGLVLGFLGHLDKNNWVNRSYEDFKCLHNEERFDLVLGQSSAAIGIIKREKKLGVPVISISHGTILSEYKTHLSEIKTPKQVLKLIPNTGYVFKNFFGRQREFIHGSDKIIAVANYVKQALVEETFVSENKVVVINNAIDERVLGGFVRTYSAKDVVDLLYVGRIVRSKGLFELIDILADPKLVNTRLLLVGDGADKKELEKFVEAQGISDRVQFLGLLPHTEAISKMKEADIFVLPTLRVEGLPMVLIEAMFAGLPIVATNKGGISDAVVSGETGFLVDPGDQEEFRAKLIALVQGAELRECFGKKGRNRAQEKFTLNVMLNKYEQVFREVLRG